MSSNTLYYFAVGGTGALTVEPLLHLCAAGLGPPRLAVTLIDADLANPAFARALSLLKNYDEVRRAFGSPSQGFFRTELLRTKRTELVWSPLSAVDTQQTGNMSLEWYAQRTRMAGATADAATLFDLLYSAEQQREQLREGFRGNPAIGAILMYGLRDSQYFKELMSGAKNDPQSSFFAAGSIFGGTGAAALPVLAEVLVQDGIRRPRIGGAIMTPYFALAEPSRLEAQDGRLKPDSAAFLRATAAALPLYTRGESQYGTIYIVGDDQSSSQPRPQYSAGGGTQVNDPHGSEFFAALAAIDFSAAEPEADNDRFVVKYATAGDETLSWRDLPLETDKQTEFIAFALASNFFLQYFGRTRSAVQQQELANELKTQAWVAEIGLNAGFVKSSAAALNALSTYMTAFWSYLWAVTHNYVRLGLISFDHSSPVSIPLPQEYASGASGREIQLPAVDNCLYGYAPRRKKKFGFRTKEADSLHSLTEMFNWYNKAQKSDAKELPGLLTYMQAGTKQFLREWYTIAP